MKDYRLNVRFHMEDERERLAAEFLKEMPHGRNHFIVGAVLARMDDDRLRRASVKSSGRKCRRFRLHLCRSRRFLLRIRK